MYKLQQNSKKLKKQVLSEYIKKKRKKGWKTFLILKFSNSKL